MGQHRGIMKKLAGLAGAVVLATALGACSSASSSTSAKATASPMSGTETFTGTIAGAAAAKWVNSNGNAPLSFPALVFTGPVDTTIKGPVNLGSGSGTHTFVTPAGDFTVQHTAKTNGGQATVTGKSGNTCYFKVNGGTGAYTVLGSKSTGEFAGATGGGTYVITFLAEGNLLPGKTICGVNTTGNALAQGALITFKATGPLTLKQ
jgi:hypothetical protein